MSYTITNQTLRRLRLRELRPNEYRIAFDFSVGVTALAISLLFCRIFIAKTEVPFQREWLLLTLPILQVGFNWFFGLYTRLWTAPSSTKVRILAFSLCCTLLFVDLGTQHHAAIILYLLLVSGPTILPRVLTSIQHSKRRGLISAMSYGGPILVIGGAGYIGTHVVDLLLKRGFRVRVLDSLMYGAESIQTFLTNPRFEFVEGDATDIEKLVQVMRGAYGVIHLAGLVGDPACAIDETFTRHTNIVVTRMVKAVAKAAGVSRFVFASSCSVYGVSDSQVDELSALNPVSLYARTKIDSERELLAGATADFSVVILRFATVFGHSRRLRFDLVGNLFTAQAANEGRITVIGPDQWRPFVHVRDVARAAVTAMEAPAHVVQRQIFNVGDSRMNYTIGQLAEIVQRVMRPYCNVKIDVIKDVGDPRNYAVSFKKINSVLQFEARTSVEVGIKEMADHFVLGRYGDYRQAAYSNVEITKQAVMRFYEPEELAHLYGPLDLRVGTSSERFEINLARNTDPGDAVEVGSGSAK